MEGGKIGREAVDMYNIFFKKGGLETWKQRNR